MIEKTQVLYFLKFVLVITILQACESNKEHSAWDVVDMNSIFILESRDIPNLQDSVYKQFFVKSGLYISSAQKSTKDDFDFLFSYSMKENTYDSILKARLILKDHKLSTRLLNGYKIHEINNDKRIQLSFAYLNGIFVLSRSSFLVENAIRVFENSAIKSFKLNNETLFQFPSLKSDHGNIYLNVDRLSDIGIKNYSLLKSIPLMNELSNLSVYDIKSKEEFISLSGFSIGDKSSLALFQKQKPNEVKIAKYVPNYIQALIYFGISDFGLFNEVVDSIFISTIDVGNEIAIMSAKNSKSLIAFVELKPNATHEFSFITDYSETYFNSQITSIDGEVFKRGFGKIFPDTPFRFSATKDNYLFLTQSIEEMRSLLEAVENDDTWGKTSDYQKFSENGLQESNVTLILKNPDLFSKEANILSAYQSLIDSLGLSNINWLSMQMSALDNHFYSNINFSLGKPVSQKAERNGSALSIDLLDNVRFISVVKNHTTGSQELFVQDSDLTAYLISSSEGIIWNRKMDSSIQGSLAQLDYYNNGKLQYFFSSKDKLYIIDRLGRDVSGFPRQMPVQTKFSELVDYDKSKNYRFVISSSKNEVYLYDKKGDNLSEWGPKKFESEIAFSPKHFKIRGKDYFVVILSDGTIQTFSRKGDRVNTFKVKGNSIAPGDLFIESGMSSATTYFYYISTDGELVKQNINGEVVSVENLLRGKNSKFILKRVNGRDTFFIYRIDTDKIVVFDMKGKILFERQNSGSTNFDFQCVEYPASQLIFCFYDVEQKLVLLFDESGNSLTQGPLESDMNPLIGFGKTKRELIVYTTSQNSVIFNSVTR